MTDEMLMAAVRDGDVGRLGELFERHHGPLYDFLSRMTGDRVAAEDLVQDVFVRILKYRHAYREDGSFETWMFRIARNARVDYFKGRRVSEPIGPDKPVLESPAPGPQQQLERKRDADRLTRAWAQLPEEKRELLTLAKYREMKYERIAELLGVDTGTVKVRVHRAVKDLREIFLRQATAPDEERSCNVKKSGTNLRAV